MKLGKIGQGLTNNITQRTLEVWGATAPIVCFGAPLGSLLLTPKLQSYLRIVFYFIAIGQFIGFAILKISGNPNPTFEREAWTSFIIASCLVAITLTLHFLGVRRRILGRGARPIPISCHNLLARLLPNHFEISQ